MPARSRICLMLPPAEKARPAPVRTITADRQIALRASAVRLEQHQTDRPLRGHCAVRTVERQDRDVAVLLEQQRLRHLMRPVMAAAAISSRRSTLPLGLVGRLDEADPLGPLEVREIRARPAERVDRLGGEVRRARHDESGRRRCPTCASGRPTTAASCTPGSGRALPPLRADRCSRRRRRSCRRRGRGSGRSRARRG